MSDVPAVIRPTRVAVLLTSIAAGSLLLLPSGDGSYECDRPPAWLLVDPAAEDAALRQHFFDEGYQCNRDARRRGLETLTVLAVGGAAFGVLTRRERRP